MQAYHQSASTLNLLRAFTKGGFADLEPRARVDAGVRRVEPRGPPLRAARQRDRPGAASSCGPAASTPRATTSLSEVDVYTSHEALLLGYEEALTRQDSLTGGWYDCSAHMLWIGERTRAARRRARRVPPRRRQPDRLQDRPVDHRPSSSSSCASALNPARIPGRLTLISRMGADTVEDELRPLLRAGARRRAPGGVGVRPDARQHVHRRSRGRKTRDFDDICAEIDGFVRAHHAEGTWPGGIHVELTGDNVTECIGGADKILDSQLDDRYETVCDPRLNARQSLDLAFHVAEMLRASGLA